MSIALLLLSLVAPAMAQQPSRSTPPSERQHRGEDRISTSPGVPGGVVVLWPRIIPASTDPAVLLTARSVQARLVAMAREQYPNRAIDVRPEPQRACPQAGCQATSFSALIVQRTGSCAVVGLVATPGRSHTTLVPWAGKVDLKLQYVPFREPPESSVVIRDFLRCDDLAAPLAAGQPLMVQTLVSHSQ